MNSFHKIISTNNSVILNVFNKITYLKPQAYVFYSSLIFYSFLWFFNPQNKIIAVSFLILIFIFYHRLKDIRLSLLLSYLTSIIIFTGKRYLIQLLPLGIFPVDLYPLGYVVYFVISPKHILAFIMFIFLVRDIIKTRFKLIQIKKADLLVIFYFFWILASDVFGSKNPAISLLFSIASLHLLIFYIYLKTYIKKSKLFFLILLGLFASQILFESLISFQQFAASSPIFKNIEEQVDIEYFGHAVDELQFRFRPVGTFAHANVLGLSISFFLSVIFVYLYKQPKPIFFTALIGGVITLAMTLSRSSWIGFAASIITSLFILERIKKIRPPPIFTKNMLSLSVIAILLVAFFVLPRAEKSIYSFGRGGGGGYLRTLQIRDTLNIIARNPIFGIGTFMSVQEGILINPKGVFTSVPLGIHNWYLLTAAEHGIPALLLFASFLLVFIKPIITSIIKKRMQSLKQFIKLGLVGGIISLLVVGLFQPFIGEEFILLSFGILWERNNQV